MEQKTFQTKALELYNPNKHNEKAIFEFAIDGETKTELLETVCAAPESQDILVHFIPPKTRPTSVALLPLKMRG